MRENYLYLHPKFIFSAITRKIKSKTPNMADIIEWCAEVETRHIKDIESMIDFRGIGQEIDHGLIKIPCNVFRIIDIYDEGENQLFANNNGSYLHDIRDMNGNLLKDGDTVYLNYSGIPVDQDGIPLIAAGHEIACETYCKISMFEEDALFAKVNANVFFEWKQTFPLQCKAARNVFQKQTRNDIEYVSMVMQNMIQKIGDLPIKQNMKS